MKEKAGQVITRAILGALLAVLVTGAASAQLNPASLTSADGRFVVLSDRGDVLQDAGLTRLTAEEVQILIESEAADNPRALESLAGDPEARKSVLENLLKVLAIASEARKTGFTADESVKMQLTLAREEQLAFAYDDYVKAKAGSIGGQAPPLRYIADKNVEAFFGSPANKAKYAVEQEKFLKFIALPQGKTGVPADIGDEQKQYILGQWKKITYGAVKARELHLDNKRVDLLTKLQQAMIVARLFSMEKLKDVLALTDDEVKAYMATNARFSKEPMRARAEAILAKLGAGSDFAALANEFSEDPGNKDPETGKGNEGLYDWNRRDSYVKEFSDAAWALNAGQASQIVETQFGYHIIKLEDKRVQKDKDGNDEEQIKVRHILISTMYKEEPKPDSAGGRTVRVETSPITMEEGARKELAAQKQEKVLAGIIARNPIGLPSDFHVDVPAETVGGSGEVKAIVETPPAKKAAAKKAPAVKAQKSTKKGKAGYTKKKQ
jgi:hypothetical protein